MKKIFKYQIPCKEQCTVTLPKGALIIRCEDVDGKFFLWAIVDPDATSEIRYLEYYKTGQEIKTPLEHLKDRKSVV